MSGFFFLMGLTLVVMAIGHCLLGLILNIPFAGRAAATYWIITIAAALCGIAFAISWQLERAA